MGLREEIREQPDSLARLIDQGREAVDALADALRGREFSHVFLAARGTSDNAGVYAKYVFGAFNGLAVSLAAPSLFSMYDRVPRLSQALVVGISQSGQSPDIVGVLAEGRRQGAPTLAITNDLESPLAKAAEFVIDIRAGEERAVAATKTYSAQLVAVAMISAALAQQEDPEVGQKMFAELGELPAVLRRTLELEPRIEEVAPRYRYMQQCVVLGRGFNYATAFEWSLKLKELTYVMASPYSSADFRHGPIAVVAPGFPILAVAPHGSVHDEMIELLGKLRDEKEAELLVLSDSSAALDLADIAIQLPEGVPEWLSPMTSIIPAQLFCLALTRIKGYDTDRPRGLTKITRSH